MTRGLAFLPDPGPSGYGARLARLRWSRAVAARIVADWSGGSPAREALAAADSWVLVRDASALPAAAPIPEPAGAAVLLSKDVVAAEPAFVHTLRELETVTRLEPDADARRSPAAAAFRADAVPAGPEETVDAFAQRIFRSAPAEASDAAFSVIRFEDPSDRERIELTRRLPDLALRILDVGCGAGGGIGSAKARHRGWHVTGIERDPRLALRARERCDRVLEGDLRNILPRLAAGGERFDVLVFADVLEHLEDPVEALRSGRLVAAAEAILVASVPNVGHLSIVRDLCAGRFDPVPAGLLDAGHLRWFTRGFLASVLEEAGWSVTAIDSERGAPAPVPETLLALAGTWPEGDADSLLTYQWVATAVNRAT